MATTPALQTADDFRRVVVDYATEAAGHGAVYLEAIFSPAEPAARGVAWQEVFEGYCDGAQEAREQLGVEMRLTPDITRAFSPAIAEETVAWCGRYRERGVVAVGLGGPENAPEPFAPAFKLARSLGLGAVPHAGEAAGPASMRGALDALGADRIRHGIRAVEDPVLVAELAERGTVLDVTPVSNLRTRVVAALDDHPLRALRRGRRALFDLDRRPGPVGTDLTLDYAMAAHLGASPRWAFDNGVAGALCDEATRARLARIGDEFDWTRSSGRRRRSSTRCADGRRGRRSAGDRLRRRPRRRVAGGRPATQAASPSPRAGTIGCASVASEVATVSSLATVPRPTNTADNTAPHSRAAADTPSATWMP